MIISDPDKLNKFCANIPQLLTPSIKLISSNVYIKVWGIKIKLIKKKINLINIYLGLLLNIVNREKIKKKGKKR